MDASNLKIVKSETVTDTASNGGRATHSAVVDGARQNMFPIVTSLDRTNGITRFRKFFFRQDAEGEPPEIAYNVAAALLHMTNGDDRKYIGAGGPRDTQGEVEADEPVWTSTGQLNADLSGGETSISLAMETNDAEFEPGGWLYISNRFLASQTIADGVNPGDSVLYDTDDSTWKFVSYRSSVTYPYGHYIDDDIVLTDHGAALQEKVQMADGLTEDEVIGTGDATTTPTIAALANVVNGLFTHPAKYRPVITFTTSSTEQTITVGADGVCSGYCSAGQLNMTDGSWDVALVFTAAPDDSTDITITYYDQFWSWSSNVVTIELTDQISNAYPAASTYAGGCVSADEVAADYDSFTDANSIYDEATYPLVMNNPGTEDDDFTITMDSGSSFTCSGNKAGSVGSGSISSDFEPVNPDTGEPFFKMLADGWQGSPTSGMTITFSTYAAAMAFWGKQVVPAGADSEKYNNVHFEVSAE